MSQALSLLGQYHPAIEAGDDAQYSAATRIFRPMEKVGIKSPYLVPPA